MNSPHLASCTAFLTRKSSAILLLILLSVALCSSIAAGILRLRSPAVLADGRVCCRRHTLLATH